MWLGTDRTGYDGDSLPSKSGITTYGMFHDDADQAILGVWGVLGNSSGVKMLSLRVSIVVSSCPFGSSRGET